MSASVEFVTDPFKFLDEFVSSNKDKLVSSRDAGLVHDFARKEIEAMDPSSIPLINGLKNLDSINSQSVVKFRGMIQDMFDPEFYLAYYETKKRDGSKGFNCGIFTDHVKDCDANIDANSKHNVTLSKTSYLCISVPGENQWIRDELERQRIKTDLLHPTNSKQINHLETDAANSSEGGTEEGCNKKLKTTETEVKSIRKEKLEERHFFPINDCNKNRKAFLLQVYEQNINFKLNDLVEVIGIIDFGPIEVTLDALKKGSGDEKVSEMNELIRGMELEETGFNVSPKLVPRIHVVEINKIKHMNPLVCSSLGSPAYVNIDSSSCSASDLLRKIRTEVHAVFSQVLFGDSLAADYLICSLVSRIYRRQDILTLGSFPLSIYNLPKMEKQEMKGYIDSLYQVLSNVVTHSVYFPLSLESLNKGNFVPKKDYSLNKLLPGNLQLPGQILLFVDETAMDPGQLTADGVANLKALGDLVKWQKLGYDFQFSRLDIETDVNVLVLSEGKSMLDVNFGVHLSVTTNLPADQVFPAIREYLNQELLDNIRKYLTSIKEMEFVMPESVQKQIQDDFVEMRQASDGKVSSDDLHSLLTLARLMSLSLGEKELSVDLWEKTLQMESERKQRMSP